MNPFDVALKAGHGAEKILNFVSQMDPDLASKINLAINSGYPVERILHFLKSEGQSISKMLPKSEDKPLSLHEQARKGIHPALKSVGKFAVAGAAAIAAPALISELGALGPQVGAEAAAPVEEALGGAAASAAKVLENPIDKYGLAERVQKLIASGNPPEDIHTILEAMMDSKQKKEYLKGVEKGTSETLESAVSKILQPQGAPTQPQPLPVPPEPPVEPPQPVPPPPEQPIQVDQPPPEPLPDEVLKVKKEPLKKEPLKKGSKVLTDSGQEETVKGISKDNILVEKDGKTKQIKSDQVIDNPVGEEELTKLYDDLVAGIEKHTGKQVSRNVNLAGYDADANELTYTPHDGATYVYDKISKEDADMLMSLMPRKTTGRNHIGTWVKGTESPIGAAMSELKNRLIAKAKEEGRTAHTRKFSQIYDAFSLPRQLSIKAERERKKAETAREREKEKTKRKKAAKK